MSTQPDTSEAVKNAIIDCDAGSEFHTLTLFHRLALAAIAADRKALAEAGYVVAPVVKVKALNPETMLDGLEELANGYNLALRDMVLLGLPIEIESEHGTAKTAP